MRCTSTLLPMILGVLLGASTGACLAFGDDEAAEGASRTDTGRIPGPLADLGGVDAGDAGGSDSADPTAGGDWDEWGTVGTLDDRTRSPKGYALCGLSDIRTDDVGSTVETEVPDGSWGNGPVADELGRCGDDTETIIWRLTNCERMSRRLPPLACDLRLVWVARQHSLDMVTRDFFDHENPDGEGPEHRYAEHGIEFRWLGENIANYPTLEDAHWGWMDSSGHRENILFDLFNHVGLGIVGGRGDYMLTQDFLQF